MARNGGPPLRAIFQSKVVNMAIQEKLNTTLEEDSVIVQDMRSFKSLPLFPILHCTVWLLTRESMKGTSTSRYDKQENLIINKGRLRTKKTFYAKRKLINNIFSATVPKSIVLCTVSLLTPSGVHALVFWVCTEV